MVKIVLKEVNWTQPDNDTWDAVIMCIRKMMSIVADVEPEDEMDKLSQPEERMVLRFLIDFQNSGYAVKHIGLDPLMLVLECRTLDSLDKLVDENRSGNLAYQLEECFSKLLPTKLKISMILLETDISILEYKFCRRKLGKERKWWL